MKDYLDALDPRTKIIVFSVMFALVFIIKDILSLLLLLVTSFLITLIYGYGKKYLSLIMRFLPMPAIAFIIWSFFHSWSLFYKSNAGADINLGLYVAIRLLSLISVSIAFALLVKPEEIIRGFEALGLPRSLAFPLALTLRCIDILSDIYSSIKEALISRGLDLDNKYLIRSIKNHIYILIPFLIRSIEVAENLVLAMELKGVSLRKRRRRTVDKLKLIDLAIILMSLASLLVSIVHYSIGVI
ncbi:MAG: energy-coupling factor transporter transmembrane component T [Sulfolobales archaeon]